MARSAQRVTSFGTTIFTEINQLAAHFGALNLGQGKPDWEPPAAIVADLITALQAGGMNQYAPGNGMQLLQHAVATHQQRFYQQEIDPEHGVVITSGATEAILAAILGLTDPGDEVIVLEPYYDSYVPALMMANVAPIYVPLRPPTWELDREELAMAITPQTRAILLNSPHNPTGHVFSSVELAAIAHLCQAHDLIAITDEVYEHLCFEGARHIPLATLPGMAERTVTISSAGKTFSATGWKIGWACGAPDLMEGVARAHQFITFAVHHPTQSAIATALASPDDFFVAYRQMYTTKRDLLLQLLTEAGFHCQSPQGTFFILANYTSHFSGSPAAYARWMIEHVGVAAVPITSFFSSQHAHLADGFIRFAFCKNDDLLHQAGARLSKLKE